MTRSERIRALGACVLFNGLSEESIRRAADAAEERHYPARAELFSQTGERCIGVIVNGSAKVTKPKRGGNVTMSILGAGDVFGAASLMDGDPPATRAESVKELSALVFTQERFSELMKLDHELTMNFCRYLIGRIRFLTARVECLAGCTAQDKIMSYLELNAKDGAVHVPFGMDAFAKAISLSRASLYRALDELEKSGKIARTGREIRLL